MAVPLLDLKAQYAPLRNDILSAITKVCDSQYFVMGPEVEGLERELAAMLGVIVLSKRWEGLDDAP